MKRHILLFILSVLLLAFSYMVNAKWDNLFKNHYVNISAENVGIVYIKYCGFEFTFYKTSEKWTIDCKNSDIRMFVDKDFELFFRHLLDIERTEVVVDHSGDLKRWGLDDPEFHITLFSRAEEVLGCIVLGACNPASTSVYAMRSGAPEVVLLGISLRDDLQNIIDNAKNCK